MDSRPDGQVPIRYKAFAALLLFAEAIIGMLLPVLFTAPSPSRQWALSLLNCFAGGVFLSAGLVHMIPDCQEAQLKLWPADWTAGSPSPVYLMLIGLGYLLVFFVERVVLDVHGENVGHVHCEHSNVFTHSHFYMSRSDSQEELGCRLANHHHLHIAAAQAQHQQHQQQQQQHSDNHTHSLHSNDAPHAHAHAHAHAVLGPQAAATDPHTYTAEGSLSAGHQDCAPVGPGPPVHQHQQQQFQQQQFQPQQQQFQPQQQQQQHQQQQHQQQQQQHLLPPTAFQSLSASSQLVRGGSAPTAAADCKLCVAAGVGPCQEPLQWTPYDKAQRKAQSSGVAGHSGSGDGLSTPLLHPAPGHPIGPMMWTPPEPGPGGGTGAGSVTGCPDACGGKLTPQFAPLHGAVLLAALSVHTFLECMALGSVPDMQAFGTLLFAIASHKAISALALSSRYFKEGATLKQVACFLVPFSLVAPVSIATGAYVSSLHPLLSLILTCLATGTFLYIGCGELTMEEFEGDVRCGRSDISARAALLLKFATVLSGAAMIALVALLPEQ